MTLQKLNIPPKTDNAAKKQMVQSNAIGANETLLASEVNSIVDKTNELVEAYNFGAPITAFNFKGKLSTYAALANIVNPQVNDGYAIEADGLVYVYNGSAFPSSGNGLNLGLKPVGKVQSGDVLAVSGDEVYKATSILDNQLFNIKEVNTIEYISELIGSDLNNTDLWTSGYLNRNTAPALNVTNWKFSKKYYSFSKGDFNFKVAISGNAVINFYDENLNIIGFLERGSINQSSLFVSTSDAPENTKYVRISHYYGDGTGNNTPQGGFSTNEISIRNNFKFYETKSETFVKTDDLKELSCEKLDIDFTNRGTEYISELIGSDLNNTDLWTSGYLNRNTAPALNIANWKFSKKYYSFFKGDFNFKVAISGNAVVNFYDENLNIIGFLERGNTNQSSLFVSTSDAPENTKYVRISHYYGNGTGDNTPQGGFSTNEISIKNNSNIYPDIVTSKNIGDFKTDFKSIFKDKYAPKEKKKIATFICDDGHINDKNWYINLLDEYNVKSTLAICKFWAKQGNDYSRLNEQQIVDYFKAGHDIANHTLDHLRMNEITLEEVENQIVSNKLYLENLLNTEITNFVSPFGIRNPNIDYIISKYHDTNFISWTDTDFNNELPLDNFFIKRLSFDAVEVGVARFESVIKPAIDLASSRKQWLIFAIHSGYPEYGLSNSVNRREELRQTIEYLLSHGYEIMTATRAYSYYKNHVNLGVRRYANKVYQLGMNNSEYNLNYFPE